MLSSGSDWFYGILTMIGLFGGIILLVFIYNAIIEKTKIKDKDGCGWLIFLLVVAIIIGILLNLDKCSCKGSNHIYDDDDTEWQYKHTDRHY